MKCPVCRATYRPAAQGEPAAHASSSPSPPYLCRRCGADLTRLLQLHDRALWHYRQAIAGLQTGDYLTAQTQVQQAISLNQRDANFHALAGQLWALQGKFPQAIAAWQQAQTLDPNQLIARECLQLLAQLRSSQEV